MTIAELTVSSIILIGYTILTIYLFKNKLFDKDQELTAVWLIFTAAIAIPTVIIVVMSFDFWSIKVF